MPRSKVEYATDQITVYRFCPYKCGYCYVWNSPLFKHRVLSGRYDPVTEARRYLKVRDRRVIVVSFVSDPYPPIEESKRLTRRVLGVLASSKHRVMVLTKNPELALRDLDIMVRANDMWLGTTLIHHFDPSPFERHAPPVRERMSALRKAHSEGVRTWISIEPIIPPLTHPMKIMEKTWDYTDMYVLGRLNYVRQLGFEPIDPHTYAILLIETLYYALNRMKKEGITKKIIVKKELLNTVKKSSLWSGIETFIEKIENLEKEKEKRLIVLTG